MKKVLVFLWVSVLAAGALAQFKDVPPDHWAAEAVKELTEQGVIEGFPDGTFRGNEPVTRYQIAMLLWRLLKHPLVVEKGMSSEAVQAIAGELEKLKAALDEEIRRRQALEGRLERLEKKLASTGDKQLELLQRLSTLIERSLKQLDELRLAHAQLAQAQLKDHEQIQALADLLALINDDAIATKERLEALARELDKAATKEEVNAAFKAYARELEKRLESRLELLAGDIGSLREKLGFLDQAKPVLEEVRKRGGLKDLEVEGGYAVYRTPSTLEFGKTDLMNPASKRSGSNAGYAQIQGTYTNWGHELTAGLRIGLDAGGLAPLAVWGESEGYSVRAGAFAPVFDAYLLHWKDDYGAKGLLAKGPHFSVALAADGLLAGKVQVAPIQGLEVMAAYAGTPTQGMVAGGASFDVGFAKAEGRAYYAPASDRFGAYVEAKFGDALEANYRRFPAFTAADFVADGIHGPYAMNQEGFGIRGRGTLLAFEAEAYLEHFTLAGTAYDARGVEVGHRFDVIGVSAFYHQALQGGSEVAFIPNGRNDAGRFDGSFGVRVSAYGVGGLEEAWVSYANYSGLGWKAAAQVHYKGDVGIGEGELALRYRGAREVLKVGGRFTSKPVAFGLSAYGGAAYAKKASLEERVIQAGLKAKPLEGLEVAADFREYRAVGAGNPAATLVYDPLDPNRDLLYGDGTSDVNVRGFGFHVSYQAFSGEVRLLKDVATNTPYQRFALGFKAKF